MEGWAETEAARPHGKIDRLNVYPLTFAEKENAKCTQRLSSQPAAKIGAFVVAVFAVAASATLSASAAALDLAGVDRTMTDVADLASYDGGVTNYTLYAFYMFYAAKKLPQA